MELKPCPFCGGPGKLYPADYVHDDLSPWPAVECHACNAWVPASVWNNRVEPAHCERGAGCVCGGDLPAIRETCGHWVK